MDINFLSKNNNKIHRQMQEPYLQSVDKLNHLEINFPNDHEQMVDSDKCESELRHEPI